MTILEQIKETLPDDSQPLIKLEPEPDKEWLVQAEERDFVRANSRPSSNSKTREKVPRLSLTSLNRKENADPNFEQPFKLAKENRDLS